MMLGGYTLGIRALIAGQPPSWPSALGLLPRLAVLPHFDRAAEYMGEELLRAVLASAPAGVTLLGVDEDTALVRVPDAPHDITSRPSRLVAATDNIMGWFAKHDPAKKKAAD